MHTLLLCFSFFPSKHQLRPATCMHSTMFWTFTSITVLALWGLSSARPTNIPSTESCSAMEYCESGTCKSCDTICQPGMDIDKCKEHCKLSVKRGEAAVFDDGTASTPYSGDFQEAPKTSQLPVDDADRKCDSHEYPKDGQCLPCDRECADDDDGNYRDYQACKLLCPAIAKLRSCLKMDISLEDCENMGRNDGQVETPQVAQNLDAQNNDNSSSISTLEAGLIITVICLTLIALGICLTVVVRKKNLSCPWTTREPSISRGRPLLRSGSGSGVKSDASVRSSERAAISGHYIYANDSDRHQDAQSTASDEHLYENFGPKSTGPSQTRTIQDMRIPVFVGNLPDNPPHANSGTLPSFYPDSQLHNSSPLYSTTLPPSFPTMEESPPYNRRVKPAANGPRPLNEEIRRFRNYSSRSEDSSLDVAPESRPSYDDQEYVTETFHLSRDRDQEPTTASYERTITLHPSLRPTEGFIPR